MNSANEFDSFDRPNAGSVISKERQQFQDILLFIHSILKALKYVFIEE